MPIRLLAPEVVSKIAAGEVVERPASVVKELIENALDAGARAITIEIEAAGQRRIRVSDDGEGIPSGQLALAVARHATSKLRSAEELERITTLGFRGEALASIAAVSRLTLTSRAKGEDAGMKVAVEGGVEAAPQAVGAAQGTVVTVEDLFYSTPARLKFLKSEPTERRLVETLVTRYALAYPGVRFRLAHEGREVFASSGSGDRRETLAKVFGLEEARSMIALEPLVGVTAVAVTGFVSPPEVSRASRREIILFVNGRWVQDPSLTAAVVQAYHTLLMVGRYPLGAVFVALPPDELDVNVHPAKREVRFRVPEQVFSSVQRTVRQALLGAGASALPAPADWVRPGWGMRHSTLVSPDWGLRPTGPAREGGERDVVGARGEGEEAAPEALSLPRLHVLGQLGGTYIVAEGPVGLYLIDQHAAHERVLFEALLSHEGSHFVSQALLTPTLVDLPAAQAEMISAELETLAQLGFDLEPFGGHMFRVRALPDLVGSLTPADALHALVEELDEDETPLAKEAESRLAARVCKRAAVKAGQVLSIREQEELVSRLERCRTPQTCPHGRPTMICFSSDQLERQFGRKG